MSAVDRVIRWSTALAVLGVAAVAAVASYWLLVLGIAATPAANVAHGLGHGPIGAAVAAWPAIALVGSYELLVMVIRSSQAAFDDTSDSRTTADPCRSKRLRCSPSSLRRTGFPQFVRSALSSTSASPSTAAARLSRRRG